MTKKLLVMFMLTALIVAWVAAPAFSTAPYDLRAKVRKELAKRIPSYGFRRVAREPVAWGDPVDWSKSITSYPYHRESLGRTMAPAASQGKEIVASYNDDQFYQSGNRQIDFRSATDPTIHFTYAAATSDLPTYLGKFGYNVYDPLAGDWPRGLGAGCEIQPTDQRGDFVNMAVNPNGLVVIGGVDDAGGWQDNHFYWQSSRHGCYWGPGSMITPAQYNVNFLDPLAYLNQPRLAIQEFGTDTILHVLAGESDTTYIIPGSNDIRQFSINYFRKVGPGQAGTWEGPITIDTMNSSSFVRMITNGSIAASRVSDDVAVAYTHNHARGIAENERYDVELYYRYSDSLGLPATWGPATNITNYLRDDASDSMSGSAFINNSSLFDTDNYLHIVWTAHEWPANVYADPTFFRGDFSANLYHWSQRVAGPNAGGTIVKAHDANFGIAWNTQVCGLAYPGCSYLGFETISECNGRLYAFFIQWLDVFGDWGPTQSDDCASGFTDRRYAANGEVCMVVSTTLDGLLWDKVRNLSKSYTPGCDSVGYGGVCMADNHVTSSRYGMDSTAYGDTLFWPGDALVMPDLGPGQSWTGHHYLHIQFLEDHYPGPAWEDRENDSRNDQTLNPIKWARVPCVEPVPAAQIDCIPPALGYPDDYIQHCEADTVTVTVRNDGNVPLNVTEIGYWINDTVSPTGWLGISTTTLNVGAGVNNTATFEVYINGDAGVCSPGTIVPLYGRVYLKSNAEDDSINLEILYVAADTVVGLEADTIDTGEMRLVVLNTGEGGFNGGPGQNGLVNMDYGDTLGVQRDCNPSSVIYLYSTGPAVVRKNNDTDYTVSYGMWQNTFGTEFSYRGVGWGSAQTHLTGANYDGHFSGTTVNVDTSIAMERTWYAPTVGGDTGNFIIVRTDMWSTGGAQTPLIIGEFTDIDLWSDLGGNNASNSVNLLPAYNTVYIGSADTIPYSVDTCPVDSNRFAAGMLLGYYTSSEWNSNNCAGKCVPYGVWGNDLHTWFDSLVGGLDDTLRPNFHHLWDSLSAHSGLTDNDTIEDQAVFSTWVSNYTLAATDTFTSFMLFTTVYDGDTSILTDRLDAGFEWYRLNLRPGCQQLCGCCVGLRGNADGSPDDVCDISDLTAIIDYLFITYTEPDCMDEANADGSGDGVVDISDLTAVIDFLFITYTPLPPC